MADTSAKSPAIVTTAIRLVTSTSTQSTDEKPIQHFEEILLNKMKQLKAALLSDTSFETLRKRLQMNEHEHRAFWTNFLDKELKIPEEKGQATSTETESVELRSWKLETRWKFVKICLYLMLELKYLLQELVSEAKALCKDKPSPKEPQNPRLNVDALSVSDQKVVLTGIQFIISLGVYPNLLPGVGIPVEKRSGYGHVIKGSVDELRNERHLYTCIEVLLECIKHASLGSIILSRHLGDIVTGLIQICYAPPASYYSVNDSVKQTHKTGLSSVDESNRTVHSQEVAQTSILSTTGKVGPFSLHCEVESQSETNSTLASSLPRKESSGNSCETANEREQITEIKNNENENFISASQREKSLLELQKLVNRVYQPLIIRELLMIQGGSNPKRQQKNKALNRKGAKTEDKSFNQSETPEWFRDVCGELLSARLMKPNGVQAVLRGILENTQDAQDWRRCDMVARLIANCPSQAGSVEEYYSHIAPQVLSLLHVTNVELGKQFVRVASSTIKTMVKQNPDLAKKYLLDVMMSPLLWVTEIPEEAQQQPNSVVANEAALTQCIEDIHKVFVTGSDPQSSVLLSLASVIHPVFELFCFTRKGVSYLRSSCQDILLQFLKHIEPSLALKTLYLLVYRKPPPLTFGLPRDEKEEKGASAADSKSSQQNTTLKENTEETYRKNDSSGLSKIHQSCDSDKSDVTGGIPIKLMRCEYTFSHGDGGGIVIKSCDHDLSESFDDVLGSLTGDAMMNHEVQATCLVELLVSLENDRLSGEFFLHLMKELTNIVANEDEVKEEPDDLKVYDRQAKAHQRSLLILHLLALMCDKLGPCILKDVHQMLAFIKSTLQRGCVLCEAEGSVLEGGIVSETLTMAFGMLSAIMGGSKVESREKSLLQELLPLLEKLSARHPDAEVRDMANDLRIAIATHGAVWSQQMKDAAENLGKMKQGNVGNAADKKDSLPNSASPSADSEFDKALTELCDPLLPVRGYAMITLSKLLHSGHPKAIAEADTLMKIFTDQMSHDDSYIYLAAIQGMVALAAIKTDKVLPYLAREFATCRSGEKGTAEYQRSPETKMKLGEALVKAVRECGDLVPRYSQHLMSSLLSGVRDTDELVRASSLSNIGDVCKLLRFSVGPIIQEVFSCLSSVLKSDPSDQVRRAAVLVITLLLQGLGKDSIQVLSCNLKEMYRLLKAVETCDKDETTRLHAQVALGQLDILMRELLFPKESFSKRIQVLP